MAKARRKKHFSIPFKKPLLIVAVVGLLALGLWQLDKSGWLNVPFLRGDSDSSQTEDAGPTPEEKAADDAMNADKKQDLVEAENKAETPTEATPDTTEASINLSARQESDGNVTVFTKLYGYSGGTCTLTVKNGGQTNTQTATVIYQPEYSSCAGFSVSKGALGSGTWSIKLTVTSSGTSKDKTISYEVD